MPALLLHAAAVERLAESGRGGPQEMARALAEDLEYARLGAFLPDLPWLGGLRLSALRAREAPRFARIFHDRAPVAMGLKMAELVSLGALVGTEAGLAFVCGYFTHLCLDRVLHPLVESLVVQHRGARETVWQAQRRIEWAQAVFYLRDLHGRDMIGDPQLRARFRVLKRRSPALGIGRGLYELVRLSAQETLAEAPSKAEVDAWVRGLGLYGWMLSSPLGRIQALPSLNSLSRRELYQGDEVDFPAAVDRALALSREVLSHLWEYMERGLFSSRSRSRFLSGFPEGALGACAA